MLELSHKKLDVWKFSIELVNIIYEKTGSFPQTEIYGLTNQIRRASVSVSSNIAEGCARYSKIEKARFFEMSRSSVVEIDTQLFIEKNLNFINDKDLEEINKLIESIFKMLSKLISESRK